MATGRSMGRTASTVGMMEGAFFVSRSDLLQWVNNLLEVNLQKVEQCASGAIYCQIIDSCHPGTVAMRKVNWMAKLDHEFIPNYKILQAAFDKNCIDRNVAVDMLIRAKYQDNLEFLQWMKCYWEREGAGRRDYDAVAAREGKPVPAWAKAVGNGLGAVAGLEKENQRPRLVTPAKMVPSMPGATRPTSAPQQAKPAVVKTPRSLNASINSLAHGDEEKADSRREAGRLKLESQLEEMHEMRLTLDGLERERDYYFRKLREVEILCETLKAKMDPGLTPEKIIADVQGILYAENDESSGHGAEEEPEGDLHTPMKAQVQEAIFA